MANKATLLNTRYRVMDTLLKWEGELSNSRLREVMGIEVVQSSRLISSYRKAHPERTQIDQSAKRYIRLPNPIGYGESIEDYLSLLKTEGAAPNWVERLNDQIVSPNPDWIAQLRQAIETNSAVSIHYLSMSHPNGSVRAIYPKALILAGRRWHVRAWCALRCDWRDFVLGRITRIDPTEQIEIPPVKDLAWETYVPVIIRPHSKLSKAQAKVVMAELLEGKSSKQIETRGALVGYLVQEIRASTISDQAPPDYQIEVVNVEEVSTWLFATRSNS